MRVAVWGAYGQGNLGDDLMAIGFAELISSAGFEVVSHGIDRELAAAMGADVIDTIDEMVAVSDSVVVGGGGLLSVSISSSRANERAIALSFIELIRSCQAHGRRLFLVSVGDEIDKCIESELDDAIESLEILLARSLFDPLQRSRGHLATRFELGADVVPYLARRIAGGEKRHLRFEDRSPSVAVNLRWRDGKALFAALASSSHRCEVLATHRFWRHGLYEIRVPGRLASYRQLRPFLETVAGHDVIISSKLHPGLAALGLGVPFIPYRPRPKTLYVARRFGFESLVCWTPDEVLSLLDELTSIESPKFAVLARARDDLLSQGSETVDLFLSRLRRPTFT